MTTFTDTLLSPAFTSAQEDRIREIFAEEKATARAAKPKTPRAPRKKSDRPLSMTPAAVYQRERREAKKRETAQAGVEGSATIAKTGEAVAQVVTEAMKPAETASAASAASTATPEGLRLVPGFESEESREDLGLSI